MSKCDGVNASLEAFPSDPSETADSVGDGFGDNEKIREGTDPNDPDDQPIPSGLPIWLLYEVSKSNRATGCSGSVSLGGPLPCVPQVPASRHKLTEVQRRKPNASGHMV